MSYQVLARKWRPRNFSELAGQEHVQQALINALNSERLHHAFLFTGTRGVGKTTIARILARSLNCEKGISATPCGVCSACTEINEGRFVDLIEVDAASKTKVEDTRELLENVQYAPTRGRFKVYLIDEVHMLSTHSFNALLKTLEEPPPHVKFLLATTDPQKLPVTILSRCLQFNLKRLPAELIAEYLEKILGKEEINSEPAAVALIAEAADGSMRDALSLLDQALAYGAGALKEAEVRTMLGTVDKKHVYELIQALAARDPATMMASIEQLAAHSADFDSVLNELLTLLHHIAVEQIAPHAANEQSPDKNLISQLANSISREDTQLYYQIGLIGRRDLPMAPNPKLGFEMMMLRMLAFQPDLDRAEAKPALSRPHQQSPVVRSNTATTVTNTVASSPTPGASADKTPAVQNQKKQHLEAISKTLGTATTKKKLNQKADNNSSDTITNSISHDAASKITSAPETYPVSENSPTASGNIPLPADADNWETLIDQLSLNGVPLQLAKNCVLSSCTDALLELAISESHQQLFSKQRQDILEQAICSATGKQIKLSIIVKQEDLSDTPAVREQKRQLERQKSAENAIYNDNNVKSFVETFGGQVLPKSIEPAN